MRNFWMTHSLMPEMPFLQNGCIDCIQPPGTFLSWASLTWRMLDKYVVHPLEWTQALNNPLGNLTYKLPDTWPPTNPNGYQPILSLQWQQEILLSVAKGSMEWLHSQSSQTWAGDPPTWPTFRGLNIWHVPTSSKIGHPGEQASSWPEHYILLDNGTKEIGI